MPHLPTVVTVFGTRPEAIKMAPVLRALERRNDRVVSRVVVTAQHREMLDQALSLFGVRPALDLDIMKRGQSLAHITQTSLEGLTEYFKKTNPAAVLVHGDTTTTFTAALAAFYLGIPVGHIEAGLRTGDRFLPFPEEMNRRLTDELASIFFAPTRLAKARLREREIPDDAIFVTGNSVVDALQMLENNDEVENAQVSDFLSGRPSDNSFTILFTMHRRESWGAPMEGVFAMFAEFLALDKRVKLIYPVHRNPQVKEPAERFLGGNPQVALVEPLDYFDFLRVMKRCDLVVSDSGGVQEEAPSFGKYVLVLREATERPEVVDAGFAEVCGVAPKRIASALSRVIPLVQQGKLPPKGVENPVGDGHAAERIVDFLFFKLGIGEKPENEFGG